MRSKTKIARDSDAKDVTRFSTLAMFRKAIASLCAGALLLPLALTSGPVLAESEEVIEEVVVKGIRSSLKRAMDTCLLYTSPSPRDKRQSRMPSSG